MTPGDRSALLASGAWFVGVVILRAIAGRFGKAPDRDEFNPLVVFWPFVLVMMVVLLPFFVPEVIGRYLGKKWRGGRP